MAHLQRLETEMADLLCGIKCHPMEMVRMVSSGTEATMSAITRLARGHTGPRQKSLNLKAVITVIAELFYSQSWQWRINPWRTLFKPVVPKAIAEHTITCATTIIRIGETVFC